MLQVTLENVKVDLRTSINLKGQKGGDVTSVILICVNNAYKYQVALKQR